MSERTRDYSGFQAPPRERAIAEHEAAGWQLAGSCREVRHRLDFKLDRAVEELEKTDEELARETLEKFRRLGFDQATVVHPEKMEALAFVRRTHASEKRGRATSFIEADDRLDEIDPELLRAEATARKFMWYYVEGVVAFFADQDQRDVLLREFKRRAEDRAGFERVANLIANEFIYNFTPPSWKEPISKPVGHVPEDVSRYVASIVTKALYE